MFFDPFDEAVASTTSPAEDCFAITPNDSDDLPMATKAIYVGTGGDVSLVPVRGDGETVFRNVSSGAILDVRVRAVRATGTTASDIVGLS